MKPQSAKDFENCSFRNLVSRYVAQESYTVMGLGGGEPKTDTTKHHHKLVRE